MLQQPGAVLHPVVLFVCCLQSVVPFIMLYLDACRLFKFAENVSPPCSLFLTGILKCIHLGRVI